MKKILPFLMLPAVMLLPALLNAQAKQPDKAVYTESKNPFYENMMKEISSFNAAEARPKKSFKLDFTGMDLPKSPSEFKSQFHFPPVNQGMTNTCWCFSTTSFFESEIFRLTNRKIKLSEIYTVYWEFVEKAKRYVRERGNSEFGEGSEGNAVRRIWLQYGAVPEEAYSGRLPGQKHLDHRAAFNEMYKFLQTVKADNAWDEESVVATIKSIMDHYFGKPPLSVKTDGKEMSPKEYFEKVVRLNMNDYIDFTSLMESPYYAKKEYDVPDNWWHDSDYYNVPLDIYMKILKNAVRKGYTVSIGGDVSEPGYDPTAEVAIVPDFDVPSEYINESARQMRFNNGSTTDDHGLHIVGYREKDGKDWYLVKDSGAGAHGSKNPGYYFYHEDYVKLKMMDFMVHKDAASGFLK